MDSKSRNIAVIGAGGWGLALTKLLSMNHSLRVWVFENDELISLNKSGESPKYLSGVKLDKENILFSSSTEEVIKGADFVILALPSFAYRKSCEAIKDLIRPEMTVVSVTKGLERESAMRMSEIAAELFECQDIVSLSGPSHAEEVARLVPTAVVAACEDIDKAKLVRDTFMTAPYFRIYASSDHKGVELGAALKNIIALAAGVVDGLGLGDNTKAALITRGLAEIVRFGVSFGAQPATFYGLSGIGDLIVTCESRHSRNRRVGELLAKGHDYESIKKEMKQVAEGVYAAQAVYAFAEEKGVSMPITRSIYKILFEGGDAKEELMLLMSREAKEESPLG